MTQKHLTSYVNAPLRLYKEILYKRNETKVIASFSREMVGSIVLLVFLCSTIYIPCFHAFSLKKNHSPLFQPNPFWDYQDFAEKNDFKQPGSIGVEIAEPIGRLLNKQDFDKQLEENEVVHTKAKETGLIGDFDAFHSRKGTPHFSNQIHFGIIKILLNKMFLSNQDQLEWRLENPL